jgi:hypothetical protein
MSARSGSTPRRSDSNTSTPAAQGPAGRSGVATESVSVALPSDWDKTFLLSHHYGGPKDQDTPPDKPPILFISQYGRPGDYDPLARPAELQVKAKVVPDERVLPAVPPDLPRGAPSANGHGADGPGSGDGDEEELVVVPG